MKNRIVFYALFIFALSFCYSEKIKFNASRMSGTAGNKNSSTKLIGDASVVTEDIEIAADEIELYGKDFRFIKAVGSVKGSNTKTGLDFSCRMLSYDRQTKMIVLTDGVVLKDKENDVSAKAEIIDYNQDTEIAVMQINVELLQKDNVCTSAHAVYRKKQQLLEMSGNPKIVQGQDTFRAQNISLDLTSQEITLSGRVKGSVSIENDKKESESDEKEVEKPVEKSDDEQIIEENVSESGENSGKEKNISEEIKKENNSDNSDNDTGASETKKNKKKKAKK